MTDNRSQAAPAPPDRSAFYPTDTRALPIMQGPEDMPATPWLDTVAASFRSSRRDIPGYTIDSDTDEYRDLVDAVSAATGKPWTIYVNPNTGQTDRDGVWRDLNAWRAAHPGAFKGVPATREEYDRRATAKTKAAAAADAGTAARGPATAQIAGGIGASLTDPFVVGTLELGGWGKTVAQRILFQGLTNAGVAGATLPLAAIERGKRGETLTATEAVTDVVIAGLAGAGFQGAIGEPLSALYRRTVGPARMTEDEAAAAHVLDRDAEVAATSPYEPGSATESHAARLDAAMREIVAAQEPQRPAAPAASVPRETVRGTSPSVSPPAPSADDLFDAVIAQESGGRRGIAGPDTPYGNAHGMTQVLDSTGEGVAKKLGIDWRPDLMRGTSEEAAAYQRRIGRAYFEEGLARYHGDVRKALMYYHGGPDEAKWGPKTRAYADQVLARTHGGPVVRRDLYPEGDAGEAVWAEAQRQSEIADLEIARLRRGGDATAEAGIALGSEIGDGERTARQVWDSQRADGDPPTPVTVMRSKDGPSAGRIVGYGREGLEETAAAARERGLEVDLEHFDPPEADVPRETSGAPDNVSREASPLAVSAPAARDAYLAAERESRALLERDVREVPDVLAAFGAAKGRGKAERGAKAAAAVEEAYGRFRERGKANAARFPDAVDVNAMVDTGDADREALRAAIDAVEASHIADGRPLPSTMAAAGAAAVHDADVQLAAEAGKAFDDPHGPAAAAQAAGLTHDLKASIDSGELGDVPFAARGVETGAGDASPVYESARALLDSLDMEDAAIAALRACL